MYKSIARIALVYVKIQLYIHDIHYTYNNVYFNHVIDGHSIEKIMARNTIVDFILY